VAEQNDGPVSLKLGTQQRESCNGRERDAVKHAFLPQNIMDDRCRGMELVVSEEIDHVVKVTGARPLREGAYFLGVDFFVAVAPGQNPAPRERRNMGARRGDQRAAIPATRRFQVELDSWQIATIRRNRPR
jgi:hypothetical protein